MGEFEGRVEGHRDGHGFVIPDNGEPSIYLAQQEMRSVLHKDRVRVRILRYDRKGRPEGRVLDILERRKTPSSAACCTKVASGWSRRKTAATARTS
jgi:ribonuclease R